jgi:hypothetical protein
MPGELRLLHEITPLILTLNEEANIRRRLAKLTWAKGILVIDGGSIDRTLEIMYYTLQRSCAEVMLSIELLDRRSRSATQP